MSICHCGRSKHAESKECSICHRVSLHNRRVTHRNTVLLMLEKYTPTEAAVRLGISRSRLYQIIR